MEAIFATIIQALNQKIQSRTNSRLTHTKAFSLSPRLKNDLEQSHQKNSAL